MQKQKTPNKPVSLRPMIEPLRHIVNRSSQLLFCFVIILAVTQTAHADKVVLVHPSLNEEDQSGQHDVLMDQLELKLQEAIKALGHEPISEAHSATGPLPNTANEMVAIAEIQGAQWVVAPVVSPNEKSIWLTLKVASVVGPRLEELDAEVRDSRQDERLKELLAAFLRPEGLGELASNLAGEDHVAREAEAKLVAETLPSEEEIAHREELQKQLQEEQAPPVPDEIPELEAPEVRAEVTGELGPMPLWMVQVGAGIRPLLRSRAAGTLGAIEIRVERSLQNVPRLKLRAGLDIVFGSAKAIAVHVGAAYLVPLGDSPFRFGASAEIGYFQSLSGNRVPSLSVRVAPVIDWAISNRFSLEAAVGEVGILTANNVTVTLGFSLRAGFRF